MAQVERARERLTTGVLAATLTPLHPNGMPDIALLVDHCRGLLATGCTSIVLLGTTGEANSFTVAERQSIAEGMRGGIPADKLIVGTGCCASGDTIALTRHALSLGITRALVLPPFYYKKVSDDGIFDAFASAIEGVGDQRLRIYLYLIPQFSGIEMSVGLIERLYRAFPNQIAGLKDSSGQWAATQTLCRALGDRMDVLVGSETFLRRALVEGGSGCVSATANVNAARIAELFAQRSSPAATGLEQRVDATRATFEKYPMVAALKAYLAATSGNETWRNVRPPLRPLTNDETQGLMSLLHNPTFTHRKASGRIRKSTVGGEDSTT